MYLQICSCVASEQAGQVIGPNLSKWQSFDLLLPYISLGSLAIDFSLYENVCFDNSKHNVTDLYGMNYTLYPFQARC